MKISDIVDKLNLTVCSGMQGLSNNVNRIGYTSDLLSDVLANAEEGSVWITLQTHKNIMAVASLKKLAAIILVNGLLPDEDTVGQSDIDRIPILSTSESAFSISWELHKVFEGEK